MNQFSRASIVFICISLLLVISIFAEPGCFLDPQSDFYCQEIEVSEAEFECSLFDDCNLQTHYVEGESCKYFSECEEVLCQSTCTSTFSGLCESGVVPVGEEDLWCNPGCCQYYQESTEPGCQVEENKWLCHISAKNSAAPLLNWDQSMDQATCESTCLADNYPYTTELTINRVEYYSDAVRSDSQIFEEADVVEQVIEDIGVQDVKEELTITQKLIKVLAPIFLIFILTLIAIFFYEHRHTIVKDYHAIEKKVVKRSRKFRSKKSNSEQEPLSSQTKNVSSSSSKSSNLLHELELISKIKPNKRHHDHISKRMHAKLELTESFAEFEPANFPAKSSIRKLEHLAKRFNRKRIRKEKHQSKLREKLSK